MYNPPKIKTVTQTVREAPACVDLRLTMAQSYHLCKLMHDAVSGGALDASGLRQVYETLLKDLSEADVPISSMRAFDHRGQAVLYIASPNDCTQSRLEELDAQA